MARIVVLPILMLRLLNTGAIHLDTYYPLIYQSPQNDSYFGYSTIIYSKNNHTWIMVGAPKATNPLYPDVKRPGLLYKCLLSGPCLPFQVDERAGNSINKFVRDIKQDAMLGATMVYQNDFDLVVACSPNWKSLRTKVVGIEGACYSFNGHPGAAAPQKWIPLIDNSYKKGEKDKDISQPHNIYSQTGFSAFVTKEKETGYSKLILGSPGQMVWRGNSIFYDIEPPFKGVISKRSIQGDTIIKKMREPNLTGIKWHEYAGYSVAAGRFYKRDQQLYALGAPQSKLGKGSVIIFKFENQYMQKQILFGDDIGGYFGSNLAVGDLNNDGLDDLLVASPMLATPTISLYYSNGKSSLAVPAYGIKKLQFGSDMNSRFGTAIVIEDLDMDTYEEVLVGAPHAENGKGLVAIWAGNPTGLSSNGPPDLVLRSSDFYPNLRGFGSSIAPPFDLDGNLYPEVAVGSYLSGHVILFRGRPKIELKLVFDKSNDIKLMPGARKLTFKVCAIYNSLENYEIPEIKLRRTINVDRNLRRFNVLPNPIKIYLKKINSLQDSNCENFEITMKGSSQNIYDPVPITVYLTILDYTASGKYVVISNQTKPEDDKFQKFYPKAEEAKAFLEIPFVRGCGTNNICESDLSITVFTRNKMFTLGSRDTVQLIINVTNVGEPAYNTEIEIILHPQTTLANLPSNCKFNAKTNITCNVMNPLLNQTTKSIPIDIDMRSVTGYWRSLQFKIKTGGNYVELKPEDNVYVFELDINVDANLVIAGKTHQNAYIYSETEEYVRFQHVFEVQKLGVSPVELVQIMADVPYLYDNKHKLIKFLEVEEALSEQNRNIFNCVLRNITSSSEEDETKLEDNEKSERESNKSYKRDLSSQQKIMDRIVEFENRTLSPESLPANRTMNISCDDEYIKCHKIICHVGPFKNSQSVARLILSMKLDIALIKGGNLGQKDIFELKTIGKASIIGIYKETSSKISTSLIFVSSPPISKVAPWLIAIAIILGLLLLSLLVIGLMKAGFFERKKKQELDKLKLATQSQETTDELLEDIPEEDIQTQLED